MNERPEQPPEGKLIAAATERAGLSIREASRRAGLSYGRWRQVTSGIQHVSPGNFATVHAPALTVAKMATAVGITPEEMETEGQRPDAAEIMRSGVDLRAPVVPPDSALPPILRGIDPREIEPYLAEVDRDIHDAAAGVRDPWKDAGTDPVQRWELDTLRNSAHTLDGQRVMLAFGRMVRAGVEQDRSHRRSTGLVLALSHGRSAMH